MYSLAKEEASNYTSFIWGIVAMESVAFTVVLALDIVVSKNLSEGTPSVWQYYLAVSILCIFIAIDLVFAMSVTLKTQRRCADFSLPDILQLLCYPT